MTVAEWVAELLRVPDQRSNLDFKVFDEHGVLRPAFTMSFLDGDNPVVIAGPKKKREKE